MFGRLGAAPVEKYFPPAAMLFILEHDAVVMLHDPHRVGRKRYLAHEAGVRTGRERRIVQGIEFGLQRRADVVEWCPRSRLTRAAEPGAREIRATISKSER
jgi:hypothetical protein